MVSGGFVVSRTCGTSVVPYVLQAGVQPWELCTSSRAWNHSLTSSLGVCPRSSKLQLQHWDICTPRESHQIPPRQRSGRTASPQGAASHPPSGPGTTSAGVRHLPNPAPR